MAQPPLELVKCIKGLIVRIANSFFRLCLRVVDHGGRPGGVEESVLLDPLSESTVRRVPVDLALDLLLPDAATHVFPKYFVKSAPLPQGNSIDLVLPCLDLGHGVCDRRRPMNVDQSLISSTFRWGVIGS